MNLYSTPTLLHTEYHAMLQRFCEQAGMDAGQTETVISGECFQLRGFAVGLRLDPQVPAVKIYLDLGSPFGGDDMNVYERILMYHAQLDVPYSWMLGLHPESKHLLLCSYFTFDEDAATTFPLALTLCLDAALRVQEQLGLTPAGLA